jgi:hypothetical protein
MEQVEFSNIVKKYLIENHPIFSSSRVFQTYRFVADVSQPQHTKPSDTRLGSSLINAIWFDWKHGSLWGGSSNNGEDYGIGW